MTEPAIPSAAGTSPAAMNVEVSQGPQKLSASLVNSYRVAAVSERLALHFHPGRQSDPTDFFNLCLSLARGIDYAVANSEFPTNVKELPLLLKQICHRRNDLLLQAAIMVLMISVKSACKTGWFPDKESQELVALTYEIGSNFCSYGDLSSRASNSIVSRDLNPRESNSIVSQIMDRFYPLMKMEQILASLEVKPGYGAYMVDFHVSKNTTHSPQERIRLLVAQTDNTETSACIISPQLVNLLLNGKGVERRTNVLMDTGPQIPTNVTTMLKYGTNLLQAVGQFTNHYIIIVAFMTVTSSVTPNLLDYVQPAVSTLDSDSDIIEGPSRVSLNCPISYKRIKTPVKGHSCKHLRCFDFLNFIDINSRRPSWRCPHCNQPVCYVDLRIDQNMVKVLSEVGDNVVDVIISEDGSWKAVLESDDPVDQTLDPSLHGQKEATVQQQSLPVVLDLTVDEDDMDAVGTSESEERKPVISNFQSQYLATNLSLPSVFDNAVGVNHNPMATEDDFWRVYFSTVSAAFSARSDARIVNGVSNSSPTNLMSSPVLTDAISPALNREAESHLSTVVTNSLVQNQFSAPSNMQLQQSPLATSFVDNEYGRLQTIPRHISRTPTAIQALPAASQTPSPQQRSRSSLNTLIPNGSSVTLQAALPTTPTTNGFNSGPLNPSWQHHPMAQNRTHQDRSFVPGHPGQQMSDLPVSSQLQAAYRASSSLRGEHQNLHQQQPLNQRVPQPRSQSPSLIRPSPLPRMPPHLASQRQMGGQLPSMQVPIGRTGSSHPVNVDVRRASTGEQRVSLGGTMQPVDLSSDQNWRPSGRMRGSLTGREYSEALTRLMIQPTQPNRPTEAARPPPLPVSSPPPSVPSLQALLANSRTTNASETQK
ncbi:zf-MIZ domain-containing protein [Cephalotus follicularis]|uniref:Zf-MIZ domain-containing protein n=1 Tax=Cephalotus follicularis TaxID=3775 RepID=A0A1Q3C786_CEPFO|nr:zf-MIZ domain-containing protein [Cephalotus follicularis]